MIELSGINKSFAGQPVIIDVNMSIQEGEIFAIIGESGAGKSTLLRCMNHLCLPDQGEVIIDGESVTHSKPAQLRKIRHKTAMIFQHFNLLQSRNVFDNIALPMRIQNIDEASIHQRVNELLSLVELQDKAEAYPGQLSGGQKQRVAIARALSCSPKILLCDEATSALDPETTDAILALLKKINNLLGITVVLITHEMNVVKRICHRLAVMKAGRIIEIASLGNVFKNKNSIARGLLYAQLTPHLSPALTNRLADYATNKPLLRLFFEGETATLPFISKTSRDLSIDINILLANIDKFDTITCGVLVVELNANPLLLDAFLERCEEAALTVEIIGYVLDDGL